MGSLVIAEPSAGGHRLWYVRLLVDAALADDPARAVVVVTTPDTLASAQWRAHLAPVESNIEVRVDSTDARNWRETVLEALAADRPERLVLPDGDKWLIALTRCRQPAEAVSVLLLRPQLPHGFQARVRAVGKLAVVRRARRLRWLTLFRLAMFPGGAGNDAMPEVPDPIQLAADAVSVAERLRSAHGLDDGERVVLIIGDLSERKSVAEVAEAWSNVAEPAARLVLVGSITDGVRDAVSVLAATDQRLVIHEAYIDDAEFDGWIAAADLVLALHRNVGSSGVALKAWALGVPVGVYAGGDLESDLREAGAAFVAVGQEPRRIASDLDAFLGNRESGCGDGDSTSAVQRTATFTGALLGLDSRVVDA